MKVVATREGRNETHKQEQEGTLSKIFLLKDVRQLWQNVNNYPILVVGSWIFVLIHCPFFYFYKCLQNVNIIPGEEELL